MKKRPNILDFFSDETLISKLHACYTIVPELCEYISTIDDYIDELERNIIIPEENNLTLIHECINLKGILHKKDKFGAPYELHTTLKNEMSGRLLNVCISYEHIHNYFNQKSNYMNYFPFYFETVSIEDFMQLRNCGRKTGDEFIELRNNFIVDYNKTIKK